MADRLPLRGARAALAFAASRERERPAAGEDDRLAEACRAAGLAGSDGTWEQVRVAAERAGLVWRDLDPESAVVRAGEGTDPVAFQDAVETLKARVVAAMTGGRPAAGVRRVLAAVPAGGDVLAVTINVVRTSKEGIVVARASEPDNPDVRYLWDGICLLRAAVVDVPPPPTA